MPSTHHVDTQTSTATTRVFGPGREVAGLEFERYYTKDGVDPFDEIGRAHV